MFKARRVMLINLKRISQLAVLAALAVLGSPRTAHGQEVASGIFGYQNLSLLGNSDTIVALPFARLPTSTVTVSSFSGNVITVQGTPGWTASQFVYAFGTQSNTYYVRIESGALEGLSFAITNNTTNTLSLNLNGGSLTGLAANNQISVVPHWTLGAVFGLGNGIVPSTSTVIRNTEVLVPNTAGAGINLSSASTYYLYTNTGSIYWRKVGFSTTNNDDVLPQLNYLVIRQKVATNNTFTSFGDVVLTKVNIPVTINTTNKQDNALALPRPIDVSLTDSGLLASGAFAPSANTVTHKDELLVFDNTATNFNKSAASTYYYYNSQWRKVGNSNDYSTSNVFTSGAGFILRKATTNVIPSWTNSPTY